MFGVIPFADNLLTKPDLSLTQLMIVLVPPQMFILEIIPPTQTGQKVVPVCLSLNLAEFAITQGLQSYVTLVCIASS